jgi:hypothetical protein
VGRDREIKALLKSRFQAAMCEVAHTSVEIGRVLLTPSPATAWGTSLLWEGVVPRINLWSRSVSRAELNQRSREARLRFERTDQFFIVRGTVTHSSLLRRLLYVFASRYGGLPQEGRVKELLDRWPSHLPMFSDFGWQMLDSATRAGVFNFWRVTSIGPHLQPRGACDPIIFSSRASSRHQSSWVSDRLNPLWSGSCGAHSNCR